jgi:polyisoprenoid-binding protein YceI
MQNGHSQGNRMQYISDAIACEDTGRVEKSDVLWTEAFYNASKYPQMVFKGHVENVSNQTLTLQLHARR